jgi:arylsulfatase A-like enzyme
MIKIIAGLCVGTVLSFSQAHAKTAQQSEASETALAPVPSLTGKDCPNILFIITDDMQRSMFNALPEGKGRNLTPNLDRLVSECVLMTGQHVASAVCTPSRYNVLTGHYASLAMANGLHDQAVVGFETHIKPLDATLPKFLRDAGYRTGMVGKNHVIEAPGIPEIPLDADPRDPKVVEMLRGFRSDYEEALRLAGFEDVGGIFPGNPDELRPRALRTHNMEHIAEAAVRFLDKPSS